MKAQWLYSKSYLFSHTHIRILHIWTTILPHTLTYTYTESYSLTHSIICAKQSYLYYSIKKHVKTHFHVYVFILGLTGVSLHDLQFLVYLILTLYAAPQLSLYLKHTVLASVPLGALC